MPAKHKNNFKLLSDEPILESERADFLEFEHTAKVLARAALYTDSPITIGVYGNWGSGKTSLMRLMEQIVEKEGNGEDAAVAVWFNAWQYEREEHLLVPLIATIARDIKKRQAKWEKEVKAENESVNKKDKIIIKLNTALDIMKGGGKKVHDALRSVLYGVSLKGKLGVPLLGELEISASMTDMIERYEAVTQDTLMARSLYFDAFDQLRELSHNENIKRPQIVVFIDDLDRCFPEQAVKLLESIKLVLHQPNFTFVLGIYPQIIEEFIRNKYAAKYPLAAFQNDEGFHERMNKYLDYFNDYLGKIVQIRHYVPERAPEQMHDYVRNLLEDAGVKDDFLVDDVSENDLYELIAEVGERRPREIVRRINGLIVKWRIANSEKKEDETYDLLAGLINETFSDRKSKGKTEYEQFLQRLKWTLDDEASDTYGKKLAGALEEIKHIEYHEEKITKLKELLKTSDDAVMNFFVDILDKDEHLCNVLNSQPGHRWLSNKVYREETHETYEEKELIQEKKIKENMLAPQIKSTEKGSKTFDQLIPEMIAVEGGTFKMGGEYEKPVHEVTLQTFEISATPVTQALYQAVMNENPSSFKGDGEKDAGNLPVENVSWNDAKIFCQQLTKMGKKDGRYILPTEAQWEYASRGGNKTEGYEYSGSNELDEVGWYDKNSKNKTQPVASKKPNELGIYDMSGNVLEWCLDKWHNSYEGAPTDGSAWEEGESSFRVLRGGSWGGNAQYCRSAGRSSGNPGYRSSNIGFRLVFVPQSIGS